jgi:hypothetical protein
MKNNDVAIAYVAYDDGSGGKKRPVLILKEVASDVMVMRFTTKYDNKSQRIKERYYKVQDLGEAGLNRPSWIDAVTPVILDKELVEFTLLGRLSSNDQHELASFIKKYNESH